MSQYRGPQEASSAQTSRPALSKDQADRKAIAKRCRFLRVERWDSV